MKHPAAAARNDADQPKKSRWKSRIGFTLIHISPLLIFFTGATAIDWMICAAMYVIRMFFITAGYHRYFSHRSYKTSRWFQFVLAFGSETSGQKGILWWAAHHRDHHRHSDQPEDPHSMKLYGFWYSHVGWIIGPDFKGTNFGRVADLAKFPELRWINKYDLMPALVTGVFVYLIGGYLNAGGVEGMFAAGWSSLVVGFLTSTVILYHGTFSINSLMHYIGSKRYETGDKSRNSPVLALITLGEGWHNNHHYYMASARQGFFWWEFDITYYVLKFLSIFGIVWDLQGVPKHVKYSKNMEEARAKMKAEREAKKAHNNDNEGMREVA